MRRARAAGRVVAIYVRIEDSCIASVVSTAGLLWRPVHSQRVHSSSSCQVMAVLIAALASPHHRHEFWTACLESKGCVRYCGSSCFNKAKRSQKHRNLLPHAAKPLADEHWRKPLEARRAIEAKAARLKARARYRDGYKGELR